MDTTELVTALYFAAFLAKVLIAGGFIAICLIPVVYYIIEFVKWIRLK